jgi:3-hydroxyisobutyrate dehydrogenase-like beta-hydroxyacid dehydrogenase
VSNNSVSSPAGARPTVGVVGLGAIGAGVADNLIAAGLPAVVCDVREEATSPYRERAGVAGSAADLARQCDIVVVAVVDDDQVRAVLAGPDGGLRAARPGTVFVVVSTISPRCVSDVGAEAERAGVAVLDCGVTGGPGAAASGELVCMVGGDPATIERARPVFDAIGTLTLEMGPFGAGLAAKLARNLVQYGSWLAAYEAQVLAEAAGVELGKLASAIRTSDARIGGASTLMFRTTVAPFTAGDDAGLVAAMRSASGLAHKDLSAALELGRSLGVDLPLATMAEARCDDVFGLGAATASAAGGEER